MDETSELLNAAQAADYLGVKRQRIYELTKAHRIGRQIAGYWVYTKAELDAYRAQRSTNKGGRPKDEIATPTPVAAA